MEKHRNVPVTYCPDCRGRAGLVDYKPPQGIDPRLSAFKCLDCGSLFFKIRSIYFKMSSVSRSMEGL